MRCLPITLVVASAGLLFAEEGARFGVAADLKAYPQDSPKAALASVLKAIDGGKIDYVLAQLTDPKFVDERIKRVHAGKFELQVAETKGKLDAPAVKQLRKFAAEGEWESDEDRAVVRLKDDADRIVAFRKVGDRWYLENRNKPDRPKETPKKGKK
jgi:hypothetical protein